MSTVTRTMAAAAQQTVHHVQQHQAGNGSGSSSGGGGGGSIGVGIGQIEAHNPALTVVSIVFLCLSVVVIALRMYVRLWMKRTVGMDDGLMVLSLLFIAGCTASVFEGQAHGWGLHEWTLDEEQRAGSSEVRFCLLHAYLISIPECRTRKKTAAYDDPRSSPAGFRKCSTSWPWLSSSSRSSCRTAA